MPPPPSGRRRPGPTSTDPAVLLALVAHGDVDAFGSLHAVVAPMVQRVTARVVGDASMAAEVAQEVLLEVWVKAPNHVASGQAPLAWIATIAHRRAIDRVRSEQAEANRRRRDIERSSRPDAGDPTADRATEHIEWAHVAAGLTVLTSRQREVIDLAFYQGHSYREVAHLLDIPIGTVKTRIRDALIRLRHQVATTRSPLAP